MHMNTRKPRAGEIIESAHRKARHHETQPSSLTQGHLAGVLGKQTLAGRTRPLDAAGG
jgi:hypothetical protein